MAFVNNALIIRRELMSNLVGMYKNGTLVDEINRIPLNMAPRKKVPRGRCCIHKERAVLKYKMLPILGYSVEDEEDELTPLSEYARKALVRTKKKNSILTVVDEACTACVKTNYVVTNLCKGCVGRACHMNCPKDAIGFLQNGQAQIDHNKCVNCGICKEACPYHSIVYIPIPCEEVCPVKAIQKDENGIEYIDEKKCIYCGKCINACPFGSIFEISQIFDIFSVLSKGEKLVAIVAPSIQSQYDAPLSNIFDAINEIGFTETVEVAHGAMETTRLEGLELQEKLESGQQFMTTSCCPSYVELVNKHLPEMKPFVSHTKSPMYYTAEVVRAQYPDAKIVFIGPCVGKRKEAADNELIDFVITFEELDAIFEGLSIKLEKSKPEIKGEAPKAGKGFARVGGVISAISEYYPQLGVKPVQVSNINKKNIGLLRAYAKGKAPGNFIEVMACEGGCISGPSARLDFNQSQKIFKKVLDE
ncbi:4Fe-4S dicluster domain-containing protein [Paludibacter sp. 221]|uniref:monomeric [FeFe] hydrogenase n=1 Tax=Paludibacter sp. 221 TaxID=2302939 RepID=UPI0013D1A3A1|nr:monomeric [FeFe] hydrogenase [Paludibacter sp. 221]NDV46155.1 4Fe-4S dicluster domain-containing protein [Paludibacter sp. 221]